MTSFLEYGMMAGAGLAGCSSPAGSSQPNRLPVNINILAGATVQAKFYKYKLCSLPPCLIDNVYVANVPMQRVVFTLSFIWSIGIHVQAHSRAGEFSIWSFVVLSWMFETVAQR